MIGLVIKLALTGVLLGTAVALFGVIVKLLVLAACGLGMALLGLVVALLTSVWCSV